MDKNYGTYICTGCGIGEALDVEALTEAASEQSMEAKTHEALCSAAGREMLEADKNDGVNTFVICACSRRVMQDEFNLGDDTITVRGNIREQAAWCKEQPTEEKTQEIIDEFTNEMATDYVRMACVQAQKTEMPEPYQLEIITRDIIVMGGGLAGLTAAREASKAGYKVTIIEKADVLGGKALGWVKQFPTKAPYADLEEPTIGALIAEVEGDSNITVKTSTEIARIAGSPGEFLASLKAAGTDSEWDAPFKVAVDEQDKIDKGEMEDPNANFKHYMDVDPDGLKAGSVILATGWTPADVSEYEHLGYADNDKVVTNAEF
ncbi:MAG: CoB--CoM heterodisulfide reductase iron-sulfur subunit A family protein, partial [Desulfobulbaceae bacterium]|nr:CoB--CoM heterodisulfide reductase iron-sulfur subunit A family protein [Desulfobulbaceae bacterium]